MAIVHNQQCDACGEILNGKKGNERVLKNCIEIKGQVLSHDVDPESGWREHTFISPTATSDLAFCNVDCFDAYITMQKKRWEAKKFRDIREEVEKDSLDRLEHGYTGPTKRRVASRQSPPPAKAP